MFNKRIEEKRLSNTKDSPNDNNDSIDDNKENNFKGKISLFTPNQKSETKGISLFNSVLKKRSPLEDITSSVMKKVSLFNC